MKTIIWSLLFIVSIYSNANAATYYFDSDKGSDNNIGTTSDEPWQSLAKFNAMKFAPGDKIYFKAGSQWTGQLKPQSSGTEGKPIIIDAYGAITDQQSKPCINGEGLTGAALILHNIEYWEVNNLQITNKGKKRQSWQSGVKIYAENAGTIHHIHLKNLYVHDVNGKLAKEEGGGSGIGWHCGGSKIPTKFDGILIEDCYIKTTDRDGILGGNAKIGMNAKDPRSSEDWYPSLNVVIRGNLLEDIGGDGIVPVGCDGALVEYNTIRGAACRTYNYESPHQFACGIWPWSSDNTIIQYNDVSGVKGTRDGQAYDCDYNCRNTIFQYNYSHNNEGGFMLVCDNKNGIGNVNPIIRYNISQNDQACIFHLGAGAKIYNNLIFNDKDSDVYLIRNFGNCTGKSTFENNIFFSLGTYRFDYNAMRENIFSHNCWQADSWRKEILSYGSKIFFPGKPKDNNSIKADPKLTNPGSGSDSISSLAGYKLKPSSPCINAGKNIPDNGGKDFYGNPLYNTNPDIGPHEQQ